METIASFQIDHDILTPGMYVSRVDGDVVTYDLRFKRPNQGITFPTARCTRLSTCSPPTCGTAALGIRSSTSAPWAAVRDFIS